MPGTAGAETLRRRGQDLPEYPGKDGVGRKPYARGVPTVCGGSGGAGREPGSDPGPETGSGSKEK